MSQTDSVEIRERRKKNYSGANFAASENFKTIWSGSKRPASYIHLALRKEAYNVVKTKIVSKVFWRDKNFSFSWNTDFC